MSEHILITGAGGYIGTTLTPMLLAAGYRVTALDTFWFGSELLARHQNLTLLKLDARNLRHEHFLGIDAVIDLAALSNDPCGERFADATYEINHITRARTARLAKQAGTKRYLLASSCSVYGAHGDLRHEHSPVNPLTVYAVANVLAERDTLELADQAFTVSALRLATLFGLSPRMRLDLVINTMCHNAWRHGEIVVNGGGTQQRPLLHVRDASRAMFRLLRTAPNTINGQIFNIGSSDLNLCINDMAERVATRCSAFTGHKVDIRHNGPQDLRSYCVSFEKAAERLDWAPTHELDVSIDDILHWLSTQRSGDDRKYYTLDWYCHLFADNGYMLSPIPAVK